MAPIPNCISYFIGRKVCSYMGQNHDEDCYAPQIVNKMITLYHIFILADATVFWDKNSQLDGVFASCYSNLDIC